MSASRKSRHSARQRPITLGFERLENRRLLHAGAHADDGVVNNVEAGENAAPEFALVDVNPASPSFQHAVSPRDYLSTVSVWMFGYST